MLKYLVILLDDTSVSFCHYGNPKKDSKLIPFDTLHKAIMFGMKENLTIQFVYPDYELPRDYISAIESIDHANIKPVSIAGKDDIAICDGWSGLSSAIADVIVIRTQFHEIFYHSADLINSLKYHKRVNVTITDLANVTEKDLTEYQDWLAELIPYVKTIFTEGNRLPQLNLLTDRLLLDSMNNCNAGHETISVAPDGNFHICPAFYLDGSRPVGNLDNGLDIKNQKLFRLDHAPICRECDAWHCKRCVWLNQKSTLEVNTPGHEQCVIAHLERNASRQLLADIRKVGTFLLGKEIPEIDYLDPFDKINS